MILSGFRLIPAVWFLLLSFVISPFGEICAQSKSFSEVYELKINSSGISGANVSERYFSSKSLQNSITKELNRWVNNGFPFAQIRFDSIRDLAVHQIIATLEPGPAIVNGELINHGDTSLSSKMVCRWIRFRKNQPFELQKFRKASLLLNQMPFVEQMEAPRLEWFGEKAIVHLNLQKRKVNSFTGILGVLPQSEGKGGTILTGNVDAGLNNLFGQAISLDLKWNRFAPESQLANIKIAVPAFGYNGLGFESFFDLFRQDSLLNKQKFDFRLVHVPNGLWQFKLGYATSSATSRIGLLSEMVSADAIGLYALYDPFNGTSIVLKRTMFSVSVLPGMKKIVGSNLTVERAQLEGQLRFAYPLPISSSRFAIQTNAQLAGIWSNAIVLPDQFRVGGLRSIRGFNENFFFTSQHALVSIQPQFLLDKTLLVSFFSDVMAFNAQANMKGLLKPDWAVGFGIGSEIEINQNLVQISLANGFTSSIPFDFQASKIHFGYIARF